MLEQPTAFSEKSERKPYMSPQLSEFGTMASITALDPAGPIADGITTRQSTV